MISPNCVQIAVRYLQLPGPKEPVGELWARCVGASPLYSFIAPLKEWEWKPAAHVGETPFSPHGVVRAPSEAGLDLPIYVHQDNNGIQTFFAFPSQAVRSLALQMTEPQGIGMKKVMSILGRAGCAALLEVVNAGDQEAFRKLPGLTGKEGEKIAAVLFKDKPKGKSRLIPNPDAVAGCQSLGIQKKEAEELVAKAMQETGSEDAAVLLTKALSYRVK